MLGFKPQTSGIWDHSANWATIIAQVLLQFGFARILTAQEMFRPKIKHPSNQTAVLYKSWLPIKKQLFLYPHFQADNESDSESLCAIKKSLSNRRESNYSTLTEDVTVKSEAMGGEEEEAGADENSEGESDCSSSSDDVPAEEKDRFVAQLFKFMDESATPMNKVPAINKVDLDLHKFFITVKKFGGYNRVSQTQFNIQWSLVIFDQI